MSATPPIQDATCPACGAVYFDHARCVLIPSQPGAYREARGALASVQSTQAPLLSGEEPNLDDLEAMIAEVLRVTSILHVDPDCACGLADHGDAAIEAYLHASGPRVVLWLVQQARDHAAAVGDAERLYDALALVRAWFDSPSIHTEQRIKILDHWLSQRTTAQPQEDAR